jgi:FkbM family methyltransferase
VSQCGESVILLGIFNAHPPKHRLLVDVGAYGKEISNTWLLLKDGWRGFLIEANPERISVIQSDFMGMSVDVIHSGIGDNDEELDFHIHTCPAHNSFIGEGWWDSTATGKTIRVRVRPLADVLFERGVPYDFDLLSVDAEGMDSRIVKALF